MAKNQRGEKNGTDDISSETPKCIVCCSEGPFARAYQCSFKQESRRHSFVVCSSKHCESRFEKDTLTAAEKGCVAKVTIRIKDYAKKGILHCPQCFFMLKDTPLPKAKACEEAPPPAPPPRARAASSVSASSENEEEKAEVPNSVVSDVDPRSPELPELDLDNLVVHVKSTDAAKSPTNAGGGKKQGKKSKKQFNTLNNELVQALFFEDPRRPATKSETNAWAQKDDDPVKAPTLPIGSSAPSVTTKNPVQSPTNRVPSTSSQIKNPVQSPTNRVPSTSSQIKNPVQSPTNRVSPSTPSQTQPIGAAAPAAATKQTWPLKKEEGTKIENPQCAQPKQQVQPKETTQNSTSASAKPQVASSASVKMQSDSDVNSKILPAKWKAAWDEASKEYYYWHTETKEVTWDFPTEKEEPKEATTTAKLSKQEKIEPSTNPTSPTVSTMCSFGSMRAMELEYLVVRSWVPSESDKKSGTCIRVTHGERVVLESETLDGWGIGSVLPEPGESVRQGRFPRKVLSDNPVSNPKTFAKGAHVKVIDEFTSPASGYLSTSMSEVLVVKYHAEPFIWVWAEAVQDSSRGGWVPEAVLVMA